MKSSGVRPAGPASKSGSWNDSKSPGFGFGGDRRPDNADAACSAARKTDTMSFSELMQQRRQVETDVEGGSREAELNLFMDMAADGNERIKRFLLAMKEPPFQAGEFLGHTVFRMRTGGFLPPVSGPGPENR